MQPAAERFASLKLHESAVATQAKSRLSSRKTNLPNPAADV